MNNSDSRSQENAPDFAFACQLYLQNPGYSLAELKQAGAEAQIPPELIEQALQQIQQARIQARERQQKLKLILISGITGAGLALGSLWAYNRVVSNPTYVGLGDSNNANGISTPVPTPAQPLVPPNSVAQPYTYGTGFSGKVERYLLNPEGLVYGLILSNNLQVTFPPYTANSLVTTIKLGDSITVVGDPGIPNNFAQEIHAFSITNIRTKHTIVAQPSPDPLPPPRNNYSNLSVEGTVQNWLVGHRGEIRGIILSSGAQVRFPPHVGDQLFNIARGGDSIHAQGFGTSTSFGQVLAATFLTVNGQPVNLYPNSPWPGHRHKKG